MWLLCVIHNNTNNRKKISSSNQHKAIFVFFSNFLERITKGLSKKPANEINEHSDYNGTLIGDRSRWIKVSIFCVSWVALEGHLNELKNDKILRWDVVNTTTIKPIQSSFSLLIFRNFFFFAFCFYIFCLWEFSLDELKDNFNDTWKLAKRNVVKHFTMKCQKPIK